MTPLRQRMFEDMQMRNLSPGTQEAYVRAVAQFAKYFMKSPEVLTREDVRQYLLYLIQERHLSRSSYNVARCGLQFLSSGRQIEMCPLFLLLAAAAGRCSGFLAARHYAVAEPVASQIGFG